jgi:hypothetical protein
VTSWYEKGKTRSERWRERAVDVLPLAAALVALVLFLVFWGS